MFKRHSFLLLLFASGVSVGFAQNSRIWATYYGGSDDDAGYSVVADASGNVYIAGKTASTAGISTAGSHQPAYGGGFSDAFIAKFNSAGVRQWATYYGGTDDDRGNALAVDANGDVYLVGSTGSAAGISTAGSHQAGLLGFQNAFLVKFNSAGVRQWATYYGSSSETGECVTVDGAGNVYMTGYAYSNSFISTAGSHQPAHGGGTSDAYLVKFDNGGVRQWGTYYGGTGFDYGNGVAVDPSSGDVYLAGHTLSANAISTAGAYQTAFGGGYAAYLAKFNSAGVRQWATYYGGPGVIACVGHSVVVDGTGNVYLGGDAGPSASGVSTAGSHQTGYGGGSFDVFLAKFNSAGVRQWATYYGGPGGDYGGYITADGGGNIYLAGITSSASAISTPGSHQPVYGGGSADVFIAKFNSTGTRLCATYYGGTASDGEYVGGNNIIDVDGAGDIYFARYTSSTTAISTAGSHQAAYGGAPQDGFLVKLASCFNNILSATTTSTNVPCNGQCAGTATVTPNNGTSPYTYTWSNGQTTSVITGLCAGTYSVLVSDAASSTATSTVTITQPSALTSTITTSGSNCTAATASATVTASGGTPIFISGNPTYNYLWNPSGQTTSTATGLSAGNYTATITDANGCTKTATVTITQSSAITVSVTTNPASCLSSNGDATATPSGGTPAFTYAWNNGQTTQTATGLAAGTYTVTVTDAAGCTKAELANISNPGSPQGNISALTNVLCNGDNTGSATVNVTVGTAPYTYSWNPSGQTTSTATGLSAGNYLVTVTDANGCIVIVDTTITEPTAITTTVTSTPTNCAGSTGTATINANNGTPGYTYTWNNGQTTQTATGLSSGTHTVTVTDANGCIKTETVTITQSNNTLSVTTTSTPAGCTVSNGTATANATGGTNPLIYNWNNGQTTQTATGLSIGTYTATITDSNGCTQTQTVSVTSNSTLSVTTTSTQSGCTVNNGTAIANPSSGTSPYTYVWNNNQTTQTATGLSVGTYTVTVTDSNGCTQTQTVSVTQTSGPTASATSSSTNITSGESVTLTASGGGTYLWLPSTDLSNSSIANPTATPTQTTNYCVLITDNNGCQDSTCITITVEIPCGTIYIPNAFSPNNDTENDLECVFGNCIETFHIAIYNRWGEKVFESTDHKLCWDGTHKGKALNTAVFNYYLEATLTSGEKINKKGNISLIK